MFPFNLKNLLKKEEKKDKCAEFTKKLAYPYDSKEIDMDKNIILSNKLFLGTDTKITRRNCNIFAIGGAASGKTRYFTLPNLLQANSNYLVVNDGEDVYNKTKDFFITQGYKVKCLNLARKHTSMHFNPFKYLNNDIDIIKLSKSLASQLETNSDPFYPRMEEYLLSAGIDYMMRHYVRSKCSLETLIDIFNRTEYDLEYLLDMLPSKSIGYERYQMYKTCSTPQRKDICISISKLLSSIKTNTEFILQFDEMNFEDFKEDKIILYVILSSFENKANFLATLLIEQLYLYLINDNITFLNEEEEIFAKMHKRNQKTTAERKELKYPLRFMLENIQNLSKIEDLEKILATSRPYNISFSITTNSITQLELLGYDVDVLIGNNDTIIYLGTNECNTAVFFSKLLPVEHREMYTVQFMTPDELIRMPFSDCIVLTRGYHPIIDKKYDLKKHKNYSFLNET